MYSKRRTKGLAVQTYRELFLLYLVFNLRPLTLQHACSTGTMQRRPSGPSSPPTFYDLSSALQAAQGVEPFASVDALLRRCPRPPHVRRPPVSVLRVPKTGSTTLASSLRGACNASVATVLFKHEMVASASYDNPSIVSLREPCDRLISIFRHMRAAYDTGRSPVCRHAAAKCSRHWVHSAENADAFVALLQRHWHELLPRRRPSPSVVWPSALDADAAHRQNSVVSTPLMVALPQVLWVGNFSVVLCTHELDTQLVPLARQLGCLNDRAGQEGTAFRRFAPLDLHADGRSGRRVAHHNVAVVSTSTADQQMISSKRTALDDTNDARFSLSAGACSIVRGSLYAQDHRLYSRMCGVGRAEGGTSIAERTQSSSASARAAMLAGAPVTPLRIIG